MYLATAHNECQIAIQVLSFEHNNKKNFLDLARWCSDFQNILNLFVQGVDRFSHQFSEEVEVMETESREFDSIANRHTVGVTKAVTVTSYRTSGFNNGTLNHVAVKQVGCNTVSCCTGWS